MYAINRDSPTAHSMLHPFMSSTKSVAQNERHFGHAITWLPICAIFSASPRCCAMVAHTIVSRAIHSIPLRCWGCGRCHRYGDRRLRYECPAARLACRCRHSIHCGPLLDSYGGCRRRLNGNREVLRKGLLLGASATAVTRDVGDDPLDVDGGHISPCSNLGQRFERELRIEHRSVVCARRIAKTLGDVHLIKVRRSHRSGCQNGCNNSRLNFVTAHKMSNYLVLPPTVSIF